MNDDQDQQTTEVRETYAPDSTEKVQRESTTTVKLAGPSVIAARFIYYIAGIIVALLALRVVLLLLAASETSLFVDFIYNLSAVFAWPFFGIFSYEPSYGQSVFEISSVVAIIVYALAATGLAKLFTLANKQGDAEV